MFSLRYHFLLNNKTALVSLSLIIVMTLLVLIGPHFCPHPIDQIFWDSISIGPDWSQHLYFGTDSNGRDLFSRVLEGGRISLLVGLAASMISLIIGVIYGAFSGYMGGALIQ
jgi:oligopeptide transport system permease protein